jgi:hypothetical protein
MTAPGSLVRFHAACWAIRSLELRAPARAVCRLRRQRPRYRLGTSAMTRTGPPDPPAIFIGNAITTNPVSGS